MLSEWDLLLRQARQANLLASLGMLLEERGLMSQVPPQAGRHLAWMQVVARRHAQAVEAEILHIAKALESIAVPLILLKGAAYAVARLPSARGRLFSDIDVLVPKSRINEVESALLLHGWVTTHHDAYDQHYYRTWMHELPPMQHVQRMTVIDVHHALLPETASLRPDPEKLLAGAQLVHGRPGVKVLAPADMVLHSIVHLFHGEFENGLRDLVDVDLLLRHFGADPAFWSALTKRAQELQLTRPLFYALRYVVRFFKTPVPQATMDATHIGRPNFLQCHFMDALFEHALLPRHASCADWMTATAHSLLYIRANWLRMPPWLLTRHLFYKALISPRKLQ